MGGLPAGPVDRAEHEPALWEKRVHALMILLSEPERRLMTVDELRRGIEGLGEAEYNRMAYYDRWIASITDNLLAKGVFTPDELGRKLAEVGTRRLREPAEPNECAGKPAGSAGAGGA